MNYFIYCRKSQEAEDRQIMSLESQRDEIDRLISLNPTIKIVGVFDEAFSAKQPGRPLFNQMMEGIDRGDAEGVISWHPDRLARNSMDGGRIIFALDQGTLKDLKFCSYSFANDPQGKFMLNIIFGYSKYYVDTLSINVKRGLQTKLKNGWKPNLAPIGYKNCRETRTIIPDGEHFDVIKKIFALMLSGNHTPSSIHRIVCDEWRYKTPLRKKTGGKAPAISTVYKLLSNPFYSGYIRWKGKLYSGNHIPIVTKSDFAQVQSLLGNTITTKKKFLDFPYTGLMKCGVCGLSITAELKIKPSGKQYTYYHCTRRHRTPQCTQPAINSIDLDVQIIEFLNRITLPTAVFDWFISAINASKVDMTAMRAKLAGKAQAEVTSKERQLANLTDLKVRDILSDDEFTAKRATLQIELAAAKENAGNTDLHQQRLEPAKILSLLSNRAKYWFTKADENTKRRLLKLLCQDPSLKDKKALLVAKKPFLEMLDFVKIHGCADACATSGPQEIQSVTLTPKQIKTLTALSEEETTLKLVTEISDCINQIDSAALAVLDSYPFFPNHKVSDKVLVDCET